LQDRRYQLKGVVDIISDLGTGDDNLSADKDQEHDLGPDHAIDKTREQLRLIGAEVVVSRSQAFETNGELDVTRTDNILDLKVRKFRLEACRKGISYCQFYSSISENKDVVPYRASG
jgi:hypothetical protein